MSARDKRNETDVLREATATTEQLREEFRGVTPQSALPIVENGHDAGQAQVVRASGDDLRLYADGNVKVCGNCKHFDLEKGRQEMIRQRFPERLVREQDWKLRHLGSKLDELGLCGMSGGSMVTSFVAKGCDQFKAK